MFNTTINLKSAFQSPLEQFEILPLFKTLGLTITNETVILSLVFIFIFYFLKLALIKTTTLYT